MIKALLFIGIGLAVIVGAILIVAATKPDTFSVQRTANIKAPPDKILPLISDYRNWTSWSPWEKKDPAMKRIYSGAASGKGAVYEWQGNKEVGQGRMEIADTSPSHVTIDMHFMKPLDSHSTAEFALTPKGDSTDVTWTMHGPNAFISKVITVFVSMDKMIGKDFETGLANMKTAAER